MPFVTIDLLRGKSAAYLAAVSQSVHDALVEGLGMQQDDRFQLIHQHEREEMVVARDFRGGPRSDDFLVVTIVDGLQRGDAKKKAFYRALVRNLSANPGTKPADVFVKMHETAPVNFSFADGVSGTETVAREALDRAATVPGTRDAYTPDEMAQAVTELFRDNDRARLVSMLRDDFVFKMPKSMPYGGEFVGAKAFDDYLARVVGSGNEYYSSFVTELVRLIEAEHHLTAQIAITATGKTTGEQMHVENAWVFDTTGGVFRSAQIYADTAAGRETAG
ncbi:tautomerase family protein [Amycolatopsis rhabdoformis]|uniref:Tautomerase family protein n=1 Tax=Amycolatopsis rhabdoformis TaxID=1448059 RepID=A0ABZ1IDH9_9PSEU|nr:tautomerase family protein [Amycolatopsis rhabdoformis]WSE32521.1 tautomerase family protein [Amycolatopsis rhabdoformis]